MDMLFFPPAPSCICAFTLWKCSLGPPFPKRSSKTKRGRQAQVQNSSIGEPRGSSFPQPGKGQERKNTRDIHKIIKGMENQLGCEWPLPFPVLKRGTGQIHGGKFLHIHTPSLSLIKDLLESLLDGNLSPHVYKHLKYLLPYNFVTEFHLLKKNTLFHLHSKQVWQGKLKGQ